MNNLYYYTRLFLIINVFKIFKDIKFKSNKK